jgi:HTH-type transcriptional regulator/antitoxin HigA
MIHSKNTLAVPPGVTIHEQLENRGISQKEFAMRMGMTEKHISRLINGKVELTAETALRLESVLGLPARFWNNLEAIYREQIARVERENEDEQEENLVSKFPYAKLARAGIVPKASKKQEKIANLRTFFEVAKLGIIDKLSIPGIAYRKSGQNGKSDYVLAAWAQKAKLEARQVRTMPINIEKLQKSIDTIRSYTILKPECFGPHLVNTLAECGIALVFLPHVEGSFLRGASFADGKKIILGLTVRGKDADKFWFTLFHELFHILDGHINTSGSTTEEEEKAADRFAEDTLIYPDFFYNFVRKGNFTENSVSDFANCINILPGIVLGRLQRENLVRYDQFRELKTQYTLTSQK